MIVTRTEQEVFDELGALCSSSGYIHTISFFCFRDNIYWYNGNLTPDVIANLHSEDKLIRSEISTLIGLMLKNDIDYTIPDPHLQQEYIEKTEALLKELHYTMMTPANNILMDIIKNGKDNNPFEKGEFLKESIFYGGESAYDFQYLDFSLQKYQKDNDWFVKNKGFSIYEAKEVIDAITDILHENIYALREKLLKINPLEWTTLDVFSFSIEEIQAKAELSTVTISNILNAFSLDNAHRNKDFQTLGDFNIIDANPIIKMNDEKYLLLQHYGLLEALYESPFFWFREDKAYKNIAMKHRGDFTEEFSANVLAKVFGQNNVYSNVDIYNNKIKIGEIDVLVTFANRAIVLQAKSKKLTIEARKGNNNALTKDFEKAIQDSYNQGKDCAEFIQNSKYTLVDSNSNEFQVRKDLKEIFIFCVVSDHYPALAFQTEQFLKYEQTDIIRPPFIMDVFLLDVMADMLSNPLHFLSYSNKRTTHFKKFQAQNELIILSYHLKRNLHLSDEFTMMMLDDSVSSDLDQAILVRRKCIEGIDTPEGILTKYKNTIIGDFVDSISNYEDDYAIELGFFLLTLSEESIEQINDGIQKTIDLFLDDGKNHDFTIGFDDVKAGLTIHTNNFSYKEAYDNLLNHCQYRKYRQHANNWFGMCFNPYTKKVKFSIMSNKEWSYSKSIGSTVVDRLKSNSIKIGRNEKCPCGSGKKYKKCCI